MSCKDSRGSDGSYGTLRHVPGGPRPRMKYGGGETSLKELFEDKELAAHRGILRMNCGSRVPVLPNERKNRYPHLLTTYAFVEDHPFCFVCSKTLRRELTPNRFVTPHCDNAAVALWLPPPRKDCSS